MNITSPAFKENGMIPKKYTCQGGDTRPPLDISDPPPHVESFAIIVHDHDAPNGDFVHWVIWNIDPDIREMREETTPVGAVEGTNDFGGTSWSGPCPPSGTHRYEFHLYALDSRVDLPATTDKYMFRNTLKGKILEEASMIGVYKKT